MPFHHDCCVGLLHTESFPSAARTFWKLPLEIPKDNADDEVPEEDSVREETANPTGATGGVRFLVPSIAL